MKKHTRLFLVFLATLLFCVAGNAQSKKLGLGLTIGAPTGFSLKYWGSSRAAIQGYIGGGFGGIAFGADYSCRRT